MGTHSSVLAWDIPWTEEPGGLQSSIAVRHKRATKHLGHRTRIREGRPGPVPLPTLYWGSGLTCSASAQDSAHSEGQRAACPAGGREGGERGCLAQGHRPGSETVNTYSVIVWKLEV